MKVVTRFAPSPTGLLHIGSARTALFNWLFAKHHGGSYLLRIEDTDKARSTPQAVSAILNGLSWLGLDHDGEVVYQLSRTERHQEIAHRLVKEGKAYYCYNPQHNQREENNTQYKETSRMWRDRSAAEAPKNVAPTVRLKAPLEGEMVIKDMLHSEITIKYSQLDDMVLLRSDGTPTYMLAVVVDDHDMEITHIIRGDDHLTNAFRQAMLYQALGWEVPLFAHLPLIHGPDGTKLSKRHGAMGVEAYREMGYLPQALRNYLLRLGWSHGNEEIISLNDAINWFNLDHVGISPSQFDFSKLDVLNHHYIQQESDSVLINEMEFIWKKHDILIGDNDKEQLKKNIYLTKTRVKTIKELCDISLFLLTSTALWDREVDSLLSSEEKDCLKIMAHLLEKTLWEEPSLQALIQEFVKENTLTMMDVGRPLRIALTGSAQAPSFIKVMACLGKEETLSRLNKLK